MPIKKPELCSCLSRSCDELRAGELAERYETPLPRLNERVAELEAKEGER